MIVSHVVANIAFSLLIISHICNRKTKYDKSLYLRDKGIETIIDPSTGSGTAIDNGVGFMVKSNSLCALWAYFAPFAVILRKAVHSSKFIIRVLRSKKILSLPLVSFMSQQNKTAFSRFSYSLVFSPSHSRAMEKLALPSHGHNHPIRIAWSLYDLPRSSYASNKHFLRTSPTFLILYRQ